MEFTPQRTLRTGTILTEKNLVVLRPNAGIDAREFENMLGRKVIHNVKAFSKLSKKNIL